MSCGVGYRSGSNLALLWLWRRPVTTAPFQPLAWEPPYAVGVAQEIEKKKKKKERKENYRPVPLIKLKCIHPNQNFSKLWSSSHGSAETNLTSIHEDAGSIPGLAQ